MSKASKSKQGTRSTQPSASKSKRTAKSKTGSSKSTKSSSSTRKASAGTGKKNKTTSSKKQTNSTSKPKPRSTPKSSSKTSSKKAPANRPKTKKTLASSKAKPRLSKEQTKTKQNKTSKKPNKSSSHSRTVDQRANTLANPRPNKRKASVRQAPQQAELFPKTHKTQRPSPSSPKQHRPSTHNPREQHRRQAPHSSSYSNGFDPYEARRKAKAQWTLADKMLTGLLAGGLGLAVLIVLAVNQWSQSLGAQDVHPLSLTHIQERTRGSMAYIRMRFGPPLPTSSLGYEKEIQAASIRWNVPANVLKAIIRVHTDFNRIRVDRYGGIGLMMVTPHSAGLMEKNGNLFAADINIQVGAQFLKSVHRKKNTLKTWFTHYYLQMRELKRSDPKKHAEAQNFARRVLQALQSFRKDPGQEIRKASLNNQTGRSKNTWRQLKTKLRTMFKKKK